MGKNSKKSQITGYRYSMAVHFGLCRGPVDELIEIYVGDLSIWSQGAIATGYQDITGKEEVFGGDTKEGGIKGRFNLLMGADDQTIDSTTQGLLTGGFPVPGWRGVTSVFYNGQIGSNNPYPKPWKFRAYRATKGWESDAVWYSEKALVFLNSNPLVIIKFKDNPVNADTLVVSGHTITFVDNDPDENEVVLGSDVSETITNFVNHLNFYSSTLGDVVATGSETEARLVFSGAVLSGVGDFTTIITQGGDIFAMNGAHIIYECATNNVWGRGLPTSMIDDVAFRAAADTLLSESFGLCFKWNRQDDIDQFVQKVVSHIGAAVYIDRQTGLLTIKLIRNDYDASALTAYDFTNGIIDVQEDSSSSSDTTHNEIIVKFIDPVTGKSAQVREQNLASFQALGTLISTTVEYDGCPTASLAHRLALRDLKVNSGDLRRFTLKFNRGGAVIEPGGVFKVNIPERGISNLVLRAGEIQDATLTDGTITVKAVQDVFSMPSSSYRNPQPSFFVPTDRTARVVAKRKVGELTYFDLAGNLPTSELNSVTEDTGFIKVFAEKPGGLAIEYEVSTKTTGEADYVTRSTAGFDDDAKLTSTIGYYDTGVSFTPNTSMGAVVLGDLILIDDEYCRLDALDLIAGTATIARGCIDTIPARHNNGATMWFQTFAPTTDFRDYATSEDVQVKLLTRTSTSLLDSSLASVDTVTIGGRQGRPYPPANVQINGEPLFDLTFVDAGTDIAFTWAHRDRLTQANFILDHDDVSTGPEGGTTYTIRIYDGADAVPTTLLRTASGLTGTTWTYDNTMYAADGSLSPLWIEMESTRDGLVSWQTYLLKIFRHTGFDDDFDSNFDGGA